MSKYLYGNYIVTLADQFKRIIDGIIADYGFDYGVNLKWLFVKPSERHCLISMGYAEVML